MAVSFHVVDKILFFSRIASSHQNRKLSCTNFKDLFVSGWVLKFNEGQVGQESFLSSGFVKEMSAGYMETYLQPRKECQGITFLMRGVHH